MKTKVMRRNVGAGLNSMYCEKPVQPKEQKLRVVYAIIDERNRLADPRVFARLETAEFALAGKAMFAEMGDTVISLTNEVH